MSMNFTLILDIFIAFLLLTTVLYCWKLSRRITLLHEGKEELNVFIQDFNKAILRAEDNIDQLKLVGTTTDEKLNEHIQKARFLANDLSFLMDKGENIADNLERQIGASRTITARLPAQQMRPRQSTAAPVQRPTPRPQTEPQQPAPQAPLIRPEPKQKSLLPNIETEPAPQAPKPMSTSKKKALDDVLSQISNRKKNASAPAQAGQPPAPQPAAPQPTVQTAAPAINTTKNPFDNRKLAEALRATEGEK